MIELVLFDVDGVLTDGTIWMDADGEVAKGFHVHDGLAVSLLRTHGIRSGVLSGKTSKPLDARIAQLRFDVSVTGTLDKRDALQRIMTEQGVSADQIAYVGDDVVDLPLAGVVGRFYAPADAHPLVLQAADVVLNRAGGRGVGREAAEHVLASRGLTMQEMYASMLEGITTSHVVQ
ncbi:KdsC family phosphatase [Microbacterium sp. NPDC056234]|uniref:KdsC family phosphatase n=1 Tax=Microbacterium sp. NPDC056234 TaxID=3345757 RepID=UPI0035D8C8DB